MKKSAFIWLCMSLAARNTVAFVDFKTKLVVWVVSDIVIGTALYYFFGMSREAWLKFLEWMAYGVPAAVVLFAVFIWMLLNAPYHAYLSLQCDSSATIRNLSEKLKGIEDAAI